MNRRDILKKLGIIPAALAVLPLVKSQPAAEELSGTLGETYHKGWTLKWFGWVKPTNMHVLMGHWVAVRPDKVYAAYSAVPGACGWYMSYHLFDTSVHEDDGQILVTPETSLKDAEKQKQLGLSRLIAFLNKDEKPYWIK